MSPIYDGIGGGVWESNPTDPKLSPRSNGFEVRAGHQTRCASAISFSLDLKGVDSTTDRANLGNHQWAADFDGVTVCVAAPGLRCTARRRVAQASTSPCDCMAWPDIRATTRQARGRLSTGSLQQVRAPSYETRWSGFVSAWAQSARG